MAIWATTPVQRCMESEPQTFYAVMAFAFPGRLQRRTAYAHAHTHASTNVCGTDSMHLSTGVVAHIAMAYIVMAYRVTAYTVIACAAMAYIVMVPCTCLHKCTWASWRPTNYKAYIVMALHSYVPI